MISIIVAVAENNAIGKDNSLLWKLPNDLANFKKITMGNTMIMGRKTFESLPGILPGRDHFVLTRDANFRPNKDRVKIFNSLEELIKVAKANENFFVIGGGEIYNAFMPYAEKIYLTKVEKSFEADTFFPEIDYSKWKEISSEEGALDDKNIIPHKFVVLEKNK